MFKLLTSFGITLGAALLGACGSSSQTSSVATSTAHGTLSENPPFRIASLDAASFKAELAGTSSGAQLLQLSGNPSCGVDFYYVKFWTVGGAGEATESSGALMVPTGAAPACSGPRPVVLYAHGTNTDKTFNLADITNTANTEGVLIAAMFAAQGYIVVAPNYAGYDISTLGYHPFLNAEQQSGEMIDILTAARTALPKSWRRRPVTAASCSSPATPKEAMWPSPPSERCRPRARGDRRCAACPDPMRSRLSATPLYSATSTWARPFSRRCSAPATNKAYGNIYSTPERYLLRDLRERHRDAAAERRRRSPLCSRPACCHRPRCSTVRRRPSRCPAMRPVRGTDGAARGARHPGYPLPRRATPLFAAGFGSPYLSTIPIASLCTGCRGRSGRRHTAGRAGVPLAAQAPVQPLRLAFYKNDLRNGNWAPTSPTLLCGGDADPTVFFPVNTGTMAAFWSPLVPAGLITVLDVNGTPAGPVCGPADRVPRKPSGATRLLRIGGRGQPVARGGGATHRAGVSRVRGALLLSCGARLLRRTVRGSVMTTFSVRTLSAAFAVAASVCFATPASSEDYPSNSIRASTSVFYHSKADDLSGPYVPPGVNIDAKDVQTLYLAYVRRLVRALRR